MTTEGKALPRTPFSSPEGPDSVRSFVWARGLRNPSGLHFLGDQLFAADNGL